MSERDLAVWLFEERVGRLVQSSDGRLGFAYDEDYVAGGGTALSSSLPMDGSPFDHRGAEPFFGGLLPEEGTRERLARALGISARNDFALLAEIGGECAGAVSLLPDGERPLAAGSTDGPRPLDDEELAALLDELPRRPLLAGRGVRLSLAGAQDKVAVVVSGDELALPGGAAPSTHILKVPIQGYEDTVRNELTCMRAAAELGLAVARAERREVLGREFLLVERYDRVPAPGGGQSRVHQEDFCQALGVATRMKYQAEGGPRFADLFGYLTERGARPAVDRLSLLRAALFNVLVGNADAHGKNFALLRGAEGPRLAPLYDLLCTLVYEGLSPRYAMKVGGKAEFKDIELRHWERFAEECGLAAPQVRRELGEMAKRLPAAFDAARGGDDSKVLDAVAEGIDLRCTAALSQLRRA